MTKKIPLLIDTDPGVDDALALLMAFNDTRHDVVGLTIAAGNVGLEHTVRNALKVCEIAGRDDVPVYAGCPQPLLHPSVDAAHVHGIDGFGDVGLAPAKRIAETEHAALAILRLSHEYAGELLLVALGPLTNLALALTLDPTLPQRVARLVVMGGALTGHGNITAAAEFNIGFDPEAAHIVFRGFPQFDVADWEATIAHGLLHRDVEQWLAADSAQARFYEEISRKTRLWSEDSRGEHWYAADALAMAFALHPEGAQRLEQRPVHIELAGTHTRGMTLVDWERRDGNPDNANLLLDYDRPQFFGLVAAALAAG
ncbi:nucleoside hydrolase [Xanthomonas arboricola]|uniref:Nucleoside hydrolase n=4 Tax=Xanthomonas arboricola pv. pruni TaxID=69929 RepID=A0AAP4K9J2_9XANT|nr:nucleoside hydrolase [Xanthomonas arboricola]GAE50610.1 inosine-uridine preferring nucleoside hydrolase [Xanthomonas arboricola pv. pruni str. MAFF 311562]GAE59415.1 inosine-uridine preferring nucleoside hydrolase [Xanthomonas arboricola pv. pruni MAFF 301427]KCW98682.1 nucleoside hydrolase [Xanthomonas arboricola pv. pruni]KPN08458.1 nucleoside hydrolase [Xanthomonas arboricola pv. pruni]MDN0266322.1 nucleoside hydrolase [Xanthomonas arboricola pv. pruni]